jgi:hypothetical protein
MRHNLAERGIPLARRGQRAQGERREPSTRSTCGTLVGLVERAADVLAPMDGLHGKKPLAGSWMATECAGPEVLLPGLPSAGLPEHVRTGPRGA